MAELLYSRYVQSEIVVERRSGKTKEEYLNLGYKIKEISDEFYQITKPPRLEMIFREGETDFIFDMLDEARKYFSRLCIRNEISDTNVHIFVLLIANGKIKISIFPDGTYVLK